jgi:hypothetical protein
MIPCNRKGMLILLANVQTPTRGRTSKQHRHGGRPTLVALHFMNHEPSAFTGTSVAPYLGVQLGSH